MMSHLLKRKTGKFFFYYKLRSEGAEMASATPLLQKAGQWTGQLLKRTGQPSAVVTENRVIGPQYRHRHSIEADFRGVCRDVEASGNRLTLLRFSNFSRVLPNSWKEKLLLASR